MLELLIEPLRRIAGDIKAPFHLEEVKLFFSAPDPHHGSSKTLTIDKDPAKGSNFAWNSLKALVSKQSEGSGPAYYVYYIPLLPDGEASSPSEVFDSDADWEADKIEQGITSDDVSPGDVERAYPSVFKGPDLDPAKHGVRTFYVNEIPPSSGISQPKPGEKRKMKQYTATEFKSLFLSKDKDSFYILLTPGSKELKNPFGEIIGKKG
jgi:hypothetical protein